MSVEYGFYINSIKTSAKIIEALGVLLSADGSNSLKDEPSIKIYPIRVDSPSIKMAVEEAFGFVPTAGVDFIFDKFHQDKSALELKMVRSVVALLAREDGDAALEFSTGPSLLRRRQGQLELDENWASWKTAPPMGLALDYRLISFREE